MIDVSEDAECHGFDARPQVGDDFLCSVLGRGGQEGGQEPRDVLPEVCEEGGVGLRFVALCDGEHAAE